MPLKNGRIAYNEIYALAVFYAQKDIYRGKINIDELAKSLTAIAFIESGTAGRDVGKGDLHVIIKAGCDPTAKSKTGALGLMQQTQIAVQQVIANTKIKNLEKSKDPKVSMFMAVNQFTWIYAKWKGNGNFTTTAALYNGEAGNAKYKYAARHNEIKNFMEDNGYFDYARKNIVPTLANFNIVVEADSLKV